MTTKKTQKILLVATALLAAAFFTWTLAHALWYAPELDLFVPAGHETYETVMTPEAMPLRLSVPSLNIDAKVQYVGVNAAGNMGVPNNFTDVAWYKYGPAPGMRGSAVIDGHVNNGLGLAGVFKRLGDLHVGDDVYVTRKGGDTKHFKVIALETYNYKRVPVEEIFNRADGAYLNLITCEGNWVKGEKTYDQRLVVYTKLVG